MGANDGSRLVNEKELLHVARVRIDSRNLNGLLFVITTKDPYPITRVVKMMDKVENTRTTQFGNSLQNHLY